MCVCMCVLQSDQLWRFQFEYPNLPRAEMPRPLRAMDLYSVRKNKERSRLGGKTERKNCKCDVKTDVATHNVYSMFFCALKNDSSHFPFLITRFIYCAVKKKKKTKSLKSRNWKKGNEFPVYIYRQHCHCVAMQAGFFRIIR